MNYIHPFLTFHQYFSYLKDSIYFMQEKYCQFKIIYLLKVARWKKHLCICSYRTGNLIFLFLPVCVYLFKNWPSKFLSHWQSVEPLFSSSFLAKTKKKCDSQLFGGKIQICCIYTIVPSAGPPLEKKYFHIDKS